jgi:hypothetical protein
VETLLKKMSSMSGSDLRLPVMGGTKFPTQDSIQPAKSKLKETQAVGNPKPVRPKFKTTDFGTAKVGEAMDISQDPLVQYLKKQATVLEDNESAMELGTPEEALADKTECAYDDNKKRTADWRGGLTSSFQNKKGVTDKFMEKDHDYSSGVVDRVLGIK